MDASNEPSNFQATIHKGDIANEQYIRHPIKSGETLPGICLKYGVQVEAVKKLNKLWTNDSIFARESIFIPVQADASGSSVTPSDVTLELLPRQGNKAADPQAKKQNELTMSSVPWGNWLLPEGWEMKYDQGQRRHFFINHLTKTTSWDDPRKAIWDQQQQQNARQHTTRASSPATVLGRVSPAVASSGESTPAPVIQQKWTPAPVAQQVRPAAAAASAKSAVPHVVPSGHPPASAAVPAACVFDESVALSDADKNRVRIRLRGEFSKFDNDTFELALDATNFDEDRTRAVLNSVSEETSPTADASGGHSHAAGGSGGHAVGNSGGHAIGNSGGHAVGNSGGHAVGNSGGHAAGGSGGHAAGGSGDHLHAVGATTTRSIAVAPAPAVTLTNNTQSVAAQNIAMATSKDAVNSKDLLPIVSLQLSPTQRRRLSPTRPRSTDTAVATFHHKTLALAANPSLAHGHNKSLLSKDYVMICGPNPRHRHGPNLDLHHGSGGALGPDPSLCRGPQRG